MNIINTLTFVADLACRHGGISLAVQVVSHGALGGHDGALGAVVSLWTDVICDVVRGRVLKCSQGAVVTCKYRMSHIKYRRIIIYNLYKK